MNQELENLKKAIRLKLIEMIRSPRDNFDDGRFLEGYNEALMLASRMEEIQPEDNG